MTFSNISQLQILIFAEERSGSSMMFHFSGKARNAENHLQARSFLLWKPTRAFEIVVEIAVHCAEKREQTRQGIISMLSSIRWSRCEPKDPPPSTFDKVTWNYQIVEETDFFGFQSVIVLGLFFSHIWVSIWSLTGGMDMDCRCATRCSRRLSQKETHEKRETLAVFSQWRKFQAFWGQKLFRDIKLFGSSLQDWHGTPPSDVTRSHVSSEHVVSLANVLPTISSQLISITPLQNTC